VAFNRSLLVNCRTAYPQTAPTASVKLRIGLDGASRLHLIGRRGPRFDKVELPSGGRIKTSLASSPHAALPAAVRRRRVVRPRGDRAGCSLSEALSSRYIFNSCLRPYLLGHLPYLLFF